MPAKESNAILRRKLREFTPNTIVEPLLLQEELAEIGERGYAIDDEEITRGMICVAAPVYDPDGKVAGALSCTFPTWIRDEQGIDTEIEAVLKAAKSASAQT